MNHSHQVRPVRPLPAVVVLALLCWLGAVTPAAWGTTVAPAIAPGGEHTLALQTNGLVWAWGENENGQLGNGATNDVLAPITVSALTDVMGIAAGEAFSVALRTNGMVSTWGLNNHGQLGTGSTNANSTLPAQISGFTNVIAIVAGSEHAVALKADGTVWNWGWDNYRQLGTGCTGNSTNRPILANGISNVIAIAAFGHHTVALRADGTAWVWGDNSQGQLGIGKTGSSTNLPVQMHGLTNVKGVAAGHNQTHALKTDGTVWGCGYNQYGELGNGTSKSTNLPVIASITGVAAIAAGHSHTLALKADGTVWAWGFGNYGALGHGSFATALSPVQALGLSNVIAIAAGDYFSVALKADGTIWVWGSNGKGQLGLGTLNSTNAPAQVLGLNLGTIAPIVITTVSPLPAGVVGTAYSQNLLASGGTTPYAWSVLSGNLPPGLTLGTGTGTIGGTPTGAGATYNFTARVTGYNGASTNKAFSLTISAAPVTLAITTTSPLPGGTVGTAYSQALQATGGTLPYGWSIVSGSLPAGLGLASSGTITGTPTVATTANFRARVTDAASATAERDFSLTISPGGAACATATRALPSCGYQTGVVNTVTITVTPCSNTLVYAVEDVPPTGWTASGIDNGGTWDSVNHKVKWGPFFDNTARALTYQATPAAGQSGTVQFTGTVSIDGVGQAIGGSSSLDKCVAYPHPADQDANFRLVINEVTAYGAAWKTGAAWPVAPSPIPIDYLTRAGYLWKQGEVYHYDPAVAPPLCWAAGTTLVTPARTALGTTKRVAAAAPAGTAVRALPSFYTPSTAMNVAIAITPEATVSAYAVEDVSPAGWVVSAIDNGGVWDTVNGKVKWGPFFDNTARTLGYQATPPVGATADGTFAGSASFDGASAAIGGSSTIGLVKLPPTIVTPPTTTNVVAVVNGLNIVPAGEPAAFTVGVTDPNALPWTCLWDFGDGATSTDCDPSHVFSNCGPQVVTVTVDNGFSVPASSNLLVAVPCQLTVTSLQLKLSFAKANADSAKLQGALDLGTTFAPAGKQLLLDLGGAQVTFTLDAKGKGTSAFGTCQLKASKTAGTWTIKVGLKGGSWATAWADHGLADADVPAPGAAVTIPVIVLVGDDPFMAEKPLTYTASAGKSGQAR